MNDAAIVRALKDISAELRRIRKELQRTARRIPVLSRAEPWLQVR